MISVKIPGRKALKIQHIVLDYNGTMATDGKISDEVRILLKEIGHQLKIHVLTADTFGNAQSELNGTDCTLVILAPSQQDKQKEIYLKKLGAKKVVAVGNGRNDERMLKRAAIGIAVIQKEGAAARTVKAADIVCTSITDALEMLLYPLRLTATLRN